MGEAEEIAEAWAALAEHELGPAVGMTEHCVCGWGWSPCPLAGGYDAGCHTRAEAIEMLSGAGLI
jgi:hypothetical protein